MNGGEMQEPAGGPCRPIEIFAYRWPAVFGFFGHVLVLIAGMFGEWLVFRQVWTAGGKHTTLLDSIVAQPWGLLILLALFLMMAGITDYLLYNVVRVGGIALRDGPTITIDEHGIFDRRITSRPIPWRDIEGISLEKYRNNGRDVRKVLITTRTVDRGLKRRLALRGLFSVFADWHLHFTMDDHYIPPEADALYKLIVAEAARHGYRLGDA
jgi:hypothetical protein